MYIQSNIHRMKDIINVADDTDFKNNTNDNPYFRFNIQVKVIPKQEKNLRILKNIFILLMKYIYNIAELPKSPVYSVRSSWLAEILKFKAVIFCNF